MKIKTTAAIVVLVIHFLSAQSFEGPSSKTFTTVYDEMNPVLSPDGSILYMTIANHPDNVGGKKDPGDIWYAVLGADGKWSEPIHAAAALNDHAFNGVAGFSKDGLSMFLLSHYASGGSAAKTQGISVSRKNGNGWDKPENISIPYFQNKSNIISGYISPDQQYFVFSAETYGTKGVDDIYISVRDGQGKWEPAINLGAKINTQFQELTPSLSSDGRTLYFSSNGRKGAGSFDVYEATRLDDGWTNWSEPVNMGAAVNTEGRDLFYRVDENLGLTLFTNTRSSDGYGEIKIIRTRDPLPKDTAMAVQPRDTSASIVVVERKPADEQVVAIHGRVVNAKTGEPIRATIVFQPERGVSGPAGARRFESTAATGYQAKIPSTNSYTISIEANGFINTFEKLDIQTYVMKDLEMNFRLQPIEIGTTVNLKNVLFEQSKTNLLPSSYDELDMVVTFLKQNPNIRIELSGHTDNRGIPAQNIKLSQARVDKVKDYLVSKGIDAKRIKGKGYGGSKPIASNDNEETRQLNRRVEFTIKKF